MIKVGKFSQKVYDDDYDNTIFDECRVWITEEQLKDESFMKQFFVKNSLDCFLCKGCPMAKNAKLKQ